MTQPVRWRSGHLMASVALAATVPWLLLSCGTDDARTAGSPAPTDAAQPTRDMEEHAPEGTPLERALGGVDAIVAQRMRAVEWREDVVSDCMADQGFQYRPYVPSVRSLRYDYQVFKYTVLIADSAFREEWGYGIATRFDDKGRPYAYDGAVLIRSVDQSTVDPNETHVSSLSGERRQAWQSALYGEEGDSAGQGGCLQRAGEEFDARYPAFASLTELEQELAQRTTSSDALSRAIDAWVECMAGRGFVVSDPINPADEIDRAVSDLQVTGQLDGNALAALKERELTMAAEDWHCREDTINPARHALLEETEMDFLERAPDLLDDLEEQGP